MCTVLNLTFTTAFSSYIELAYILYCESTFSASQFLSYKNLRWSKQATREMLHSVI